MNNELAVKKGLINNDDMSLYILLQEIYKYLFEVYLFSKVNLKKYDEQIKNSNYYFGKPTPTKEQLISGLREFMGLDYIYILNNFFIEKLSIDDIGLLKQYMGKKIDATPDAMRFIDRTYKDIINKNYFRGEYTENVYKVCYGVSIPSNFADNNALVFKIYYSKNTKQLEGNEFIENLINQKKFMEELKVKLKEEIKQILDLSCEVLIEKIAN